jgi:hypothetical protein
MNLDTLPGDLIFLIFKRVDYQDLLRLEKVNNKFKIISNDELLWKHRYEKDRNKWKIINSRQLCSNKKVSFKQKYLRSCQFTSKKIQVNNERKEQSEGVLSKITEFIFNRFYGASPSDELLDKVIMFGPGLETTTSCIVTNLLWKSDFKTVGMIPGRDGNGSGLKLKLSNHKLFNLTILYTNVSKLRGNPEQNIDQNKLFIKTDTLEYDINPRVRDSINEAAAFVYVIDTDLLTKSLQEGNKYILENNKIELFTLMNKCSIDKPLLILSCENGTQKTNLSCSQIIDEFELYKLKSNWQIRSCQIIQDTMKDVCLGFDWLLSEIN